MEFAITEWPTYLAFWCLDVTQIIRILKVNFYIDADARSTLMTAIIIGVLAGGRIGYILSV